LDIIFSDAAFFSYFFVFCSCLLPLGLQFLLEQRCGGEQLKSIWSVIKFLQKRINFMAGPGCRGVGENRKSISISGPKRQKSKGPEKKEFLMICH